MASHSSSETGTQLSTARREAIWASLDERPQQADIVTYDADEIAEIRRVTENDLKVISRLSGTESALNKESQSFLDVTSIVRALFRVAEDRFEQGTLDASAGTVINAIRWHRLADGLYLSGGVTLPRTDPTRMWHLLAEIYIRMDERDLALRTMQKASENIGELVNPPLVELLTQAAARHVPVASAEAASGSGGWFSDVIAALRTRRAMYIFAVVIFVLIAYTGFRAQISAKSMVDSNSLGVDYLNIAFGAGRQDANQDALVLAAQEFATLRAQLEAWSWLIAASSIVPPIRDQFEVMDKMADLGSRLVAAPFVDAGAGRLASMGSAESVCGAAERLSAFDGYMLGQMAKNRREMLASVSTAVDGMC